MDAVAPAVTLCQESCTIVNQFLNGTRLRLALTKKAQNGGKSYRGVLGCPARERSSLRLTTHDSYFMSATLLPQESQEILCVFIPSRRDGSLVASGLVGAATGKRSRRPSEQGACAAASTRATCQQRAARD